MMEEEQNKNEHEFHLSFMISGFYLLMVGFTGALFNIIALMKASQVGQMPYYYDNNKENIFYQLSSMVNHFILLYTGSTNSTQFDSNQLDRQ